MKTEPLGLLDPRRLNPIRVAAYKRKLAAAPGTLVHVGPDREDVTTRLSVLDYDAEHLSEAMDPDAAAIADLAESPTVTWFKVEGVHKVEVVAELGRIFSLHPLLLEDVVNTAGRPKMEEYENYLFVVAKTLYFNREAEGLAGEQVCLVLGKNWVISFQESNRDIFGPVAERIKKARGRIRGQGADYLAYALLDAVVDNYFLALEGFGEAVEDLEGELLGDPGQDALRRLHQYKREGLSCRRAIWPLREVLASLQRGDSALISADTIVFLRDVYDHAIQVIDMVETNRELLGGMLDIYLSSLSNRMNQVMKVLTVIATLFIPLTFLTGVYGMNFKYMPELDIRWAYPAVLGLMAVITIGMLIYFKKKHWF